MSSKRYLLPALLVVAVLAAVPFVGGPSEAPAKRTRSAGRPEDVLGPRECSECHEEETAVWQDTGHYLGGMELTRDPLAQRIARTLGIRRMKTDQRCTSCHFTMQADGGRAKAISGVSCESCHGPARGWIDAHDDFGEATSGAEEPADHRAARLASCEAVGMNHAEAVHRLAGRCFDCHVITDAELLDAGHPVGDEFELVSWTQGEMRHNFVRGAGTNAPTPPERRRVMFVVGALLDLEHSFRGLAGAPEGALRDVLIDRARRARKTLCMVHDLVPAPEVGAILDCTKELDPGGAFASDFAIVADAVRKAVFEFAERRDGTTLAALDALVPTEAYRGEGAGD